MTEAEWRVSSNPKAMLDFLARRPRVGRRMRLFAAAAARDNLERSRGSDPHDGDARDFEAAILRVEAYADGRGDLRYDQTLFSIEWFDDLEAAYWVLGYDPDCANWIFDPAEHIKQYQVNPAHWLRDIFGNPFRPVLVDPSWLGWKDGTIVKMARDIYDRRDFALLPILCDALEEAVCDNGEIRQHCRLEKVHVRGCWVLDLLLGQE